MRKFCWVYMDKNDGELWICKRPYRRAFRHVWFLVREEGRMKYANAVTFRQLMTRYVFIGRL